MSPNTADHCNALHCTHNIVTSTRQLTSYTHQLHSISVNHSPNTNPTNPNPNPT